MEVVRPPPHNFSGTSRHALTVTAGGRGAVSPDVNDTTVRDNCAADVTANERHPPRSRPGSRGRIAATLQRTIEACGIGTSLYQPDLEKNADTGRNA